MLLCINNDWYILFVKQVVEPYVLPRRHNVQIQVANRFARVSSRYPKEAAVAPQSLFVVALINLYFQHK